MRSADVPRVLCLPTGPDEYAGAMVRALASEAEVEFVAPVPFLKCYGDDLPAAVRTHPLSWPRHRDPRNLALLRRISRVVRDTTPDVIHFLGDSVVWLVLALPFLRRLPLVVTVHDVDYHPGDTQSRTVPMATIQILRRAADAIIVHGEGLRRELLKTCIAPPCGVHVTAHPVLDRHVRLAHRLGLKSRTDDNRPTVLFFGRIVSYKGLGLLIEASDHVAKACPGVRFVVAGQGPDLACWRAALAARSWFEVRDRYIPDAEAAQLFLDADVVVLPYIEASQSGVLTLAAGFGLPVLATAVGELGATTARLGMGVVTRPAAPDIAQGLIGLISNAAARTHYGRRSALAGAGELSASRIAHDTCATYRQVIRACLTQRRGSSRAWHLEFRK